MSGGVQALDFSTDLLQCLLWQYDDAANLQSLLNSKQAWYDEAHEQFWTDWVADVFDLNTANAFGLTVWANILAIPLTVQAAAATVKPTFGFAPNWQRFNQGNFAASNNVTTLTVDEARLVLRLRFFQLVTRGAAPEVNAFLAQVFGTGVVYAITTGPMQVAYNFSTALSSSLQLIFASFDILPRPAGVTVTINHP
jgi:hypothetical protein